MVRGWGRGGCGGVLTEEDERERERERERETHTCPRTHWHARAHTHTHTHTHTGFSPMYEDTEKGNTKERLNMVRTVC